MALESLDPATTTVVTMEMQRGVVGDLSTMAPLADAATQVDLAATTRRLLTGVRAAGGSVVHAAVTWRADRRGTALNAPLLRHLADNPEQILAGSPAADVIAEIGPEPSDLVSLRHSGLTPFTGTNLDATLRALGTTTVIACGVSLNVGVFGLCVEAVSLGYEVVVASDAVVGVPVEFGRELITHSLRPIAAVATVDHIVAALGRN